MFNFSPELNPVFQVSELNELIRNHLSLLGEVVVVGEIIQIKIQRQLVFITIKDENSSLDIFGISYQIPQVFSLEKGMNVEISGNPSLYQKSSKFHLRAKSVVPVGIGSLERSYQLLKHRLETEGVFDQERKRPLPQYPESILLLTGDKSQAYQDFIKVSRLRMPGIKITHMPILVQGNNAVKDIVESINLINYLVKNNRLNFDALVLTRGGGSMEDLAAFNDETVVKAVFGCVLPVVCAIGHEGDVTLAELAADKRASTPTDAAVVLVPESNELYKKCINQVNYLKSSINRRIESNSFQLSRILRKIDIGINSHSNQTNSILIRLKALIETQGKLLLENKKEIIRNLNYINNRITDDLNRSTQLFHSQNNLIKSLDPQRVLKRGYSITKTKAGKIITNIQEVDSDQSLITLLANGTILSRVINKETYDKEN